MKIIDSVTVKEGKATTHSIDSAAIKEVTTGRIQEAEGGVKAVKADASLVILANEKDGDLIGALAADYEAGKNSETIALFPKSEWSETSRHLLAAYSYREKHGVQKLRKLYSDAMKSATRSTTINPFFLFKLVQADPDGTGSLPEVAEGETLDGSKKGKRESAKDKTPTTVKLWREWSDLVEAHKDDPAALIMEWDKRLHLYAVDATKDGKEVPDSKLA